MIRNPFFSLPFPFVRDGLSGTANLLLVVVRTLQINVEDDQRCQHGHDDGDVEVQDFHPADVRVKIGKQHDCSPFRFNGFVSADDWCNGKPKRSVLKPYRQSVYGGITKCNQIVILRA